MFLSIAAMTDDSKHWNRRKFVGAGAGILTAGLAGCSSNNQPEDTPSPIPAGETETDSGTGTGTADGSSGSNLAEPQFDFVGGRTPTQVQFNPWNLANFAHTYSLYWSTPIATAYADGTISSHYLEEFSAEGKELTMKFPTGWTYWNGREMTAKDFYIQLEIERFQDPESSTFTSHELVDDQTVKSTFKTDVTPNLMKAAVVGMVQITPRWLYEEYLTRYQEATTKSERDSISEEVLKMSIPTKQFVDEGLGNSLYQIDSFNSAETIASKYPDHPWADRTNIPKTRVVPVGDNTDSLATNDKLDMTKYITKGMRQQYPSNIKNQYKLNWFRTQKFILNWNNEHLANRNVRRAILSAIDLNSITASAAQTGYLADPTQVQTGMRSSIHKEYLGEEFTNKLIKYPVSKNADTASAYMEQAGYSKQNGTWASSEGKEVSLNILTRDNVGQAQPAKVLSDQLNAFGIKTNLNAVGTDYYTKLQEWEFDLGWVWHVAKALWHPTAYFSNDFYGVLAGDPSSGEKTGPTGVPFELTIPGEVGAKEVSGSGQTIQPAKLMNDLPASTSKEQVIQRTRTLSQWFNYDLPAIVYMQENQGYSGDAANFNFPSADEKKMNANESGRYAWRRGWISGKTK